MTREGRFDLCAPLLLVLSLTWVPASCATIGDSTKGAPMISHEPFWDMLDALEKRLPLAKGKLESLLHSTFEKRTDSSNQTSFVSQVVQPNDYGVVISSIAFRAPVKEDQGNLWIGFSSSEIRTDDVERRFPGGYWVPPPPPGWGPVDAGPAYFTERPWGQIVFAFGSSGAPLHSVSLAPGQHGSPGI